MIQRVRTRVPAPAAPRPLQPVSKPVVEEPEPHPFPMEKCGGLYGCKVGDVLDRVVGGVMVDKATVTAMEITYLLADTATENSLKYRLIHCARIVRDGATSYVDHNDLLQIPEMLEVSDEPKQPVRTRLRTKA